MGIDLKALQARLIEQEAKRDRAKNGTGFSGDNAIYPFWNNPDNSTATIRYLPDGDETNGFFWVERLIIKLPFPGVKGAIDSRPVVVQVPCMDMWKPKTCPITAAISPWWKDASMESMARKYYRKKSFLFQGFVNDNPNKEDKTPENPIRRFVINPSIFDVIKAVLLDKDLENSPTDYQYGRDFYLSKTKKGEYANYTTSKWAFKERALNQDEVSAIETHGLWNLSSFLPKKPDDQHLNAIMEMFNASIEEDLYDPEKWGNFYKPYGLKTSDENIEEGTGVSVKVSLADKMKKDEPEATKEETAKVVATSQPAEKKQQSPEDIIAAIRARNSKK